MILQKNIKTSQRDLKERKNSTLVQIERRFPMKKMFSLALALIMALALSVPAFAADINIDDSYENET